MKKCFLALSASIVFTMYIYSGALIVPIGYSLTDFNVQRIGDFDVIFLSNGAPSPFPGHPALQGISKTILIPPTSEVINAELKNIVWTDVGKYNILPAQNPVPTSKYPLFVSGDEQIYKSDMYYPNYPEVFFRTGSKSGFILADVSYTPFRYNPISGNLQIITSADLEVIYEEGLQEAVYLTENQMEIFREEILLMIENRSDIDRFSPFLKRVPFSEYEYVVVCPANLSAAFEPLIRWKITRGVGAKVVTTTWITSNYPAYDAMESIRDFVRDSHQNRGLVYLVLAGDYDNLGARMVPVSTSGYSNNLPSDLYFSDVVPYTKDWDANNNNIYGEYIVDSCDFYSDVYVGRLPLNNVSEVQNWVSKVLAYEKNPPSGFIEKSLFAGAGLWFSSTPPWVYSYYGSSSCDSIADYMLPSYWTDRKMYQTDTTSYPPGFSDSLSRGFHWSYIAAHGSSSSISWYYYQSWPNIISNTTMQNLTNGDSLFVISSMACEPGWFDGRECVGEYIFNASAGGAIAVMFNARYGWGYPPYLGPSEYMCIRVAQNVFLNQIRNIGRAHALSKDQLMNWTWGFGDCEHWCINEFNLFGDPETQIYSKQPTALTVSHEDTLKNLSGILDVTVTSSGLPVSGAMCCLSKPYDTLFWFRGKTGSMGKAAVEYSANTQEPFLLTVYAKDHLYYQDTIYIDTAITSAVLTYFSDENDSTVSFGSNAPNTYFGMAHRYTPPLLNIYQGWKIKRVYFYLNGGTNTINDAVVNIYSGASPAIPGPLIFSKSFNVSGDTGWNYVVYSDAEAVSVNSSQDMWFEVGFTHGTGENPFHATFGAQCIPLQTDNFKNGPNWSYMSGYGNNICWAIKVLLKNASGVEVQLEEDLPVFFSFRAEKTFFTENNRVYFTLTRPGDVSLRVFDISGRIVSEIYRGYLGPGKYSYEISRNIQGQGVYFIVIQTEEGDKILKIEKIQ